MKLFKHDKEKAKNTEARFVVQSGSSFYLVDNEGFRHFATEIIGAIGAKLAIYMWTMFCSSEKLQEIQSSTWLTLCVKT